MVIKKFLHSCILLEKENSKLLFDPGLFSFVEGLLRPADIGAVDFILITHNHADHCYPNALKDFIKLNPKTRIIASEEISAALSKEDILCEVVKGSSSLELGSFMVEAYDAPHGELTIKVPHNMAYLVDGKFLHPGDCVTLENVSCEVLALPFFAPWGRVVDGAKFAERIKPKTVVPIHDWIMRDMVLERLYPILVKPILESQGINFVQLGLGEKLEI